MKVKLSISLGILLLSCLIIAPYIHEMVHIFTFKSLSGNYFADIGVSSSVYGSFRVLAPMNLFEYILLLSGGVVSSLLLGLLFIYLGRKKTSYLSTNFGIGFLLNPSLSMLTKNDISTLFSFINLNYLSILIGIFILGICLFEFNYSTKIMMANNQNTGAV